MDRLPISEALLREYASPEALSRGRAYERQGAVTDLVRRDRHLQANVQGSEDEPYRVDVAFDEQGVAAADCTCPYEWGGWCKHIVAALLAALRHPEAIEARPPLAETLAGLERGRLQEILLRLAAGNPAMVEAIEREAARLPATAAPGQPGAVTPAPLPPADLRRIRREVRSTMAVGYDVGYGYADSAATAVNEFVREARDRVAAGDARGALDVLEAVTGEYVEHWYEVDDSDGVLGGYFEELAAAWIEALLAADLTPEERRAWAEKLDDWQHEADDYGIDDWFGQAAAAAEEGWDDPRLQRVLRGEATEPGAWDGPPAVSRARLRILERQGRHDEYLNLAQAAGLAREQAVMLARRGRVEEAVAVGRGSLTAAPDALAVAQALHERGDAEAALRVAEHGLPLEEPRAPLAAWLSDVAEGLGRRELALRAAEVAFRSAPSLDAYGKVRALAGAGWPARQAELLKLLRRPPTAWFHPEARVDIFLEEGLIDDAIAVVKDATYAYTLLEQVMDAAIDQRPEWVIEAATAQVARIVDAGKAQHYDHAIEWLRRARDAYRAAGRAADWEGYLTALRAQHRRKYKLMGLLDRL